MKLNNLDLGISAHPNSSIKVSLDSSCPDLSSCQIRISTQQVEDLDLLSLALGASPSLLLALDLFPASTFKL